MAPTTRRGPNTQSTTPTKQHDPRIPSKQNRPSSISRTPPMGMEATVRTEITEGTCKLCVLVFTLFHEGPTFELQSQGNDVPRTLNVSKKLPRLSKFVSMKREVDKYPETSLTTLRNVKAAKPNTLMRYELPMT
ncbi:hypothetical protein Tco_1484663 [Tanacetum coccineum]